MVNADKRVDGLGALRAGSWASVRLFAAFVLVSSFSGCDDKTSAAGHSGDAGAASTAAAAASTAAAAASGEPAGTQPAGTQQQALALSVDDNALTIVGDRIAFDAPDARGRMTSALALTKRVEGMGVVLVAARNARATRVALVVASLHDAKATDVEIKSTKRDNTTASLHVSWEATPPCTPVASIGKDVSIYVWNQGGGAPAKRFAKGMAGPDITLGSDALRKGMTSKTCNSALALLGADDGVMWGLLFDLALAANEGPTAGQRRFSLLPESPVPGRKVTPL
jgi:hypothetical protein